MKLWITWLFATIIMHPADIGNFEHFKRLNA
jgi:hypothetical protein